jgi:alpha-N-arabinofuranosidase
MTKKLSQAIFLFLGLFVSVYAQTITLIVDAESPKPISSDLFGIFFEDLNYAADGALYAELIQNRSFEYSAVDHTGWHAFTAWELVDRNGGRGSYIIGNANPLHFNNPHYIEMDCDAGREDSGFGLMNSGFDGIVLKKGQKYDFTVFARQQPRRNISLEVRLESKDGTLLGRGEISQLTNEWKQYTVTLEPDEDDSKGRLVLLAHGRGVVYLDMISLFPQNTFRNRKNGLRADLAQVIADLKPKFIRFPGGCLVHGDGLNNFYRWKDTIGPVHERKEQKNIWRYHQSVGLGYYEYFQFCEDIGAKPLPVVPAGVSCQNTDRYWGVGQQALPMSDMPAYVRDVLDLIEWASGPADSEWGAKRAAAGHPEPFGLKYLGVGNEDVISPEFKARYKMINDAVKARYPGIIVIGTTGPATDGRDYEEGWKFAREQNLPMVDEHGYKSPGWFWDNLQRFDAYGRTGTKVYLGEYAAHERNRANTLRSALAEAAYMTSLERNGDLVHFASYAPLLSKQGRTQWRPDLIYFDNVSITPSVNYYVQQLFSLNQGDVYLPTTLKMTDSDDRPNDIAASTVRDTAIGDVIIKLVSKADEAVTAAVDLSSLAPFEPKAIRTVLSGAPAAENQFGGEAEVLPEVSEMEVSETFDYEVPAHSLSVIRLKSL